MPTQSESLVHHISSDGPAQYGIGGDLSLLFSYNAKAGGEDRRAGTVLQPLPIHPFPSCMLWVCRHERAIRTNSVPVNHLRGRRDLVCLRLQRRAERIRSSIRRFLRRCWTLGRYWTLASIVVLLILGFGARAFVKGSYTPNDRVLQVELRHDLPVGTTREQIDLYLTQRKIGHSYSASDNTIYGLIPDVKKGPLSSQSIQVIISLDAQQRLKGLEVKSIYTGP
jgi:hypothetical protein